jgi:hypothetical protein
MIYTFEYPYANELNPKLYKYIDTHADKEEKVNLIARKTKWQTFTKDFLIIANWVKQIIPKVVDPDAVGLTMGVLNNNDILHLTGLWGVIYEKGEGSGIHNHYPNRWSFVYYVNVPEGSAPLIICGDTDVNEVSANPTVGGCILFPSWMNHYVSENNCNGRCALVGNFNYQPQNSYNQILEG